MTYYIIFYVLSVVSCCYAVKKQADFEGIGIDFDITALHGVIAGFIILCPLINTCVMLNFTLCRFFNYLDTIVVRQRHTKSYTLEDYRKEFAYRDPDYNP